MNFVSANIILYDRYSRAIATIGGFVMICALGQGVVADEAKSTATNQNISSLDPLNDSSSNASGRNEKSPKTYNELVDADARELVKDLESVDSSVTAKELIEKIFSSDASKAVKHQGRKTSLSKLASLAEKEGRLEEAQQYLAEYVKRFPDDVLIPFVLLRQGNLYRNMGAYDLGRQKYYDVIKAAPGVKLDNDEYNLNYVKRAVLTAQIKIAESYFDEAKKMPTKSAEVGYSNSVDQFEKLKDEGLGGVEFDDEDGGLSEADLSLKLIRALHELSISRMSTKDMSVDADKREVIKSFERVHAEGDEFIETHDTAATEKMGEVLYYVLHAIKKLNFDSNKILEVFRDLYWLRDAEGKTLPWILKGADELGQYFFLENKYKEASDVFLMYVELIAGAEGGPGKKQKLNFDSTKKFITKLLETLYGLEYAEMLIDKIIEEPASRQDVINFVRDIVNAVNSEAEKMSLELPSLSNIDEVASNAKLKDEVARSIKFLKSQANTRYRAILPVLYKLGLCYENLSSDDVLGVFERIPAGIVRVKPLNGELADGAYFDSSDNSLKFHIVKSLDKALYPDAALVCLRGGEIKKGDVVSSKDGKNELEIEHFLSLDSLLTQENLGDGSLSLRLIRDMAVWRVNNLSWLSKFEDRLNDVK